MDDVSTYVALFALAAAVVTCALKGKWWFAGLAVFMPLFFLLAIIGSFRLAKPNSFWARRFYDEDQFDAAVKRFTTAEQYEELRKSRIEKNQGRSGLSQPDDGLKGYGRIGGSKDEIGEIAPPLD
ncbi:MAG: hypothetical protein WBW44_02450 [Solirubrobacterales bacterium]